MRNEIVVTIEGWQDGVFLKRKLESLDRWDVHSAEAVLVDANGVTVRLCQQPHGLAASDVGVGACLWDSALVLTAFLAQEPRHRFIGARCVELGAGVGLAGIFLAKLGARVILTDQGSVLPLLQRNVADNNLHISSRQDTGSAEVQELTWGTSAGCRTASCISQSPIDFVLAADCCYIDQDGSSPSVEAFVETCRTLSTANTRCLVAFEKRTLAVHAAFLRLANQSFHKVICVPRGTLPALVSAADHVELYELRNPHPPPH